MQISVIQAQVHGAFQSPSAQGLPLTYFKWEISKECVLESRPYQDPEPLPSQSCEDARCMDRGNRRSQGAIQYYLGSNHALSKVI
jgi:hypothetical protein